jgi:uncharacterized protein YdaU (DUF1376 family)
MMKKASTWMPLYIGDYLRDTAHLGALESGAYLHLIMHYWETGGLPSDDKSLARISKTTPGEWKEIRSTMEAFFKNGWRHSRVESELSNARANLEAKKKASAVRWGKRRGKVVPIR